MVTVRIGPAMAQIENYKWISSHQALAKLLNLMLPLGGPSPADPNPDLNAAKAAVAELGGEIADPGPVPMFDPQAIY